MSYYPQAQGPFQGGPSRETSSQQADQQYGYLPSNTGQFFTPYATSTQQSYNQNRNAIPGLAFGAPAINPAWQPAQEPNTVPASSYYVADIPNPSPDLQAQTTPAFPNAARAPKPRSTAGTAEEGELSEGEYQDEYRDLYESTGANFSRSNGAASLHHATSSNGIADRGWNTSAPQSGHISGRERSGSYSPYLSPTEIQPGLAPAVQYPSNSMPTSYQPALQNGHDSARSLSAVKQRAREAVVDLCPANVTYDDYIKEGIDPDVVKTLYREAGLDPAPTKQVSRIPGLALSRNADGNAVKPPTEQTPTTQHQKTRQPIQPQPAPLPPASSSADKSEERKDRIARLLAAKGTKSSQASAPGSAPAPPETAEDTPTTVTQDNNLDEKQLKQQEKLEALQKSREARAQKAASLKNPQKETSDASNPEQPPPLTASGPLEAGASSTGKLADYDAAPSAVTNTSGTQRPAVANPATAPGTAVIPGLFMSTTPNPGNAPAYRQRPVASDFTFASGIRSFSGRPQQEKFVIEVSDGSDDEDVEMEIASGDESTQPQTTGTPIEKTTSFRDVPPLPNTANTWQVSSPAPSGVATPPGHLETMAKQIEAIKRKIALAEARQKLRSTINGNNGQPSTGSENEMASEGAQGTDPTMPRRPHSGGLSNLSADSVLTKLSKASKAAGPDPVGRAQRVRALSQKLPNIDSRLQAKKSKLRLLQSEATRLQKEIDEEFAEKQKLADELDSLQQEESDKNMSDPVSQDMSSGGEPTTSFEVAYHPRSTDVTDQAATSNATPAVTDGGVSPEASAESEQSEQSVVMSLESEGEDTGSGQNATDSASVQEQTVPDPYVASVSRRTSEGGFPPSQPTTTDGLPNGSSVKLDELQPESQEGLAESDGYEPEDLSMHLSDGDTDGDIYSASSEQEQVPAPVVDASEAHPDAEVSKADDQPWPELISIGANDSQPDEGLGGRREGQTAQTSQREPRNKKGFVTYQSPLGYFRGYRFHPEFLEKVSGGLRSLTFSNNIDVNIPVCPDELDGRPCERGPSCEFQHFESMRLPDDQILLQLGGTHLEGAERAQFNNGLRDLLQDLKSRNIRDFASISKAIVEYHRQFRGDPSKVLSLGDVSL